MIPVPWIVSVLYFVGYAAVGMALGVLAGILVSLVLGPKTKSIMKNGLLGSAGFLLGFIGTVFMPWPQNTVTYYENGVSVTSTMNSYQHPERVAVVVAILLPVLNAFYLLKRNQMQAPRS